MSQDKARPSTGASLLAGITGAWSLCHHLMLNEWHFPLTAHTRAWIGAGAALSLLHPQRFIQFFSFWSFCHFCWFVCPRCVSSCSGQRWWLVVVLTLHWERDARETFRACFLHRSLVLVATRGRPEGLPEFASHLVSLGFAKTADLSSKGPLLAWEMAACPVGSAGSF